MRRLQILGKTTGREHSHLKSQTFYCCISELLDLCTERVRLSLALELVKIKIKEKVFKFKTIFCFTFHWTLNKTEKKQKIAFSEPFLSVFRLKLTF